MRRVANFFRGLIGAVSGTAAVEFALFLFFILMPFLFGIFEIGRALQQHHVVTKSVRDAARYIARMPGYDAATPFEVKCAETGAMLGATTPAGNAKDLAMYGVFNPDPVPPGNAPPPRPLMAAWDVLANSGAYQTVCIIGPVEVTTVTSNLKINVVTVTASVPFDDVMLKAFGIGPITFEVSHQERYIGQ